DRAPICRPCGFDLTGLPPDTSFCPECGRDLAVQGAVQVGHRRKLVPVIALGVLLLLAAILPTGALVVAAALGRDVNVYKPTWLLCAEARWSNKPAADRIAIVLFDRMVTSQVLPAAFGPLVDAALAIQADPSDIWSDQWARIIERAMADGVMTPEQLASYQQHALRFRVETRAVVEQGGMIPVFLILESHRTASNANVVPIWVDEVSIAGRTLPRPPRFSPALTNNDPNAIAAMNRQPTGMIMPGRLQAGGQRPEHVAGLALVPADLPLGEAEVQVRYSSLLTDLRMPGGGLRMGFAMAGASNADGRAVGTGRMRVQIVAPTSDRVTVRPPSELSQRNLARRLKAVEASVQPVGVDLGVVGSMFGAKRQRPHSIVSLSFLDLDRAELRSMGIPFAFDVYLKEGETLTRLGSICSNPLAQAEMSISMPFLGDENLIAVVPRDARSIGKTIDLVFKPSESTARRTRDLTSIAGDTIEINGIDLQDIASPAQRPRRTRAAEPEAPEAE
ncbi:MAG: hypothetical protein K2X32_05350, partial [Phycisphaerales bacterium]|nr:hypothetical protein [Phycisphaerales bacterium]